MYDSIQPHYCYIKPKNLNNIISEDKINKIIVSFDIESTQENGEHCPNLLVSNTICDICYKSNSNECSICGHEEKIYFGKDCIIKFCNYLFEELALKAEHNKSLIYAFAHNARGYDSQFILREIWNRYYERVEIILRGRKILKIQCSNVKILDSLNYFLQSLDKLPKALGLDIDVRKGEFPHLFNIPENYKYQGNIPDIKYFSTDYMTPERKEKFEKWYIEQFDRNDWNFMEELINYCKNDVNILKLCIMKFRTVFKEISGIDPITRSFTLAAIGAEVFSSQHLGLKELANTPANGKYNNKKYQSRIGNAWLDLQQFKQNITLIREYRIGKYWVDGYDKENNTVYEFFGCRFHGHDCIPVNNTLNLLKTNKKIKYLKSRGYKVNYIWECQLNKIKKVDVNVKNYINDRYNYYRKIESIGNLQIRDAFFGGRTNNLQFYKKCSEDEEIKYLDFCSLYPYVLKYREYPIDHPTIITENFDYSLEGYFGFAKCKVIAPRGLYLPVLPVMLNKKLMFPLCVHCANDKNQNQCICDDRSFIGTWTTVELKKAIEKGYIIDKIYEVYHYEPDKRKLFKKYVDMWLKIKQEASGWPKWVTDENSKLEYIKKYEDREGIKLEYDKINKNDALRYIAKIMLNSYWGKLAQKPNQTKTEIIKTYDHYWSIISDLKKEVKGEFMANDDTLILSWKFKNDSHSHCKYYNIAVAAYVAAHARLKLYELMEKIEKQRPYSLLYHDTDSVLYIKHNDDEEIETGDYLGELTNEIKTNYGDGAKCIGFVSLGPKNYGYEVIDQNGNIISNIKTKGISQVVHAANCITFEEMLRLANVYAHSDETIEIPVPQRQFIINRHSQIFTRYFDKIYRAISEKRVIHGNITLPYGY